MPVLRHLNSQPPITHGQLVEMATAPGFSGPYGTLKDTFQKAQHP